MSSGELLAGAAKVDVTPPIGRGSQYGKTTEIDLPLYTKALVLNNGEETVAINTNDLIFIDRETVVEVRKIVAGTLSPFQRWIPQPSKPYTYRHKKGNE